MQGQVFQSFMLFHYLSEITHQVQGNGMLNSQHNIPYRNTNQMVKWNLFSVLPARTRRS